MSAENKAIVRRFMEDGWNKGDLSVIEACVTPDFVDHDPANPPHLGKGIAGAKQVVNLYRSAFPDLHFTIEDLIAEGDKVVVRYRATGTHKGELMGLAPTNRRATVTAILISRIAGGKIAEQWSNWDTAGLLQQLGAASTSAKS